MIIHATKGSATSGNRGHSGRPGKVGGSAPKSTSIITMSNNLSDNEIEALDSYKGGSWDYSTYEYAKSNPFGPVAQHYNTMDSAINKGVLNEDIVVHRGVRFQLEDVKVPKTNWTPARTIKAQKDPFDGAQGTNVHIAGFVSTTTSPESAAVFAREIEPMVTGKASPKQSRYIIELNVPKGSHAIDLSNYGGSGVLQKVASGEQEILLPRNGTMRINSIGDPVNGVRTIQADWIEQAEKAFPMKIRAGYKGGSGSGNWGHEGRPGKEGGSLPTGKSATGTYADQRTGARQPGVPAGAGGTAINLPRISVPVGTIPQHQKGDADGKLSYQAWYESTATAGNRPNLADALAMRRYFAERALEAEQVLAEQGAVGREESRKKRAEEEAAKGPVLTPAQKKKQEAEKKKAAAAVASAAKKKAAEEAKKKKAAEAAAKKAATAAKKTGTTPKAGGATGEAAAKREELAKQKAEAVYKVAESVGISKDEFNEFKNTVASLKAGESVPANTVKSLIEAGLVTQSGDTVSVPAAALSLLSAINARDAIKAKTALAKLQGATKEIGLVRVRKATRFIIESKGSATSGNRGHAGRPGKVGGSMPKGNVVMPVATLTPIQQLDKDVSEHKGDKNVFVLDKLLSNNGELAKQVDWGKYTMPYTGSHRREVTIGGVQITVDTEGGASYHVVNRIRNPGKTRYNYRTEITAYSSGKSEHRLLFNKTVVGEHNWERQQKTREDWRNKAQSTFGFLP